MKTFLSEGENFGQERETKKKKKRKGQALIVLNQKLLSLEEIQQMSVLSSYSNENSTNHPQMLEVGIC